MAKGLRSSVKKSNRAKLRSSVFGPVEDARRERLSVKLLELASRPRPTIKEDAEMDIEDKAQNTESKAKTKDVNEPQAEVMDVDGRSDAADTKSSNPNRVQKKRRNKSRASIVFPGYRNRKRIGPPKKQRR